MQYKQLTLDNFQVQAFKHIDTDESVIISAPTGAGKTLMVDYAIEHVFKSFKRLIYTSPIKALSNQKFRDFSKEYGRNNVGILTGDVSINRDASILIMTTEVLRNILYVDQGEISNVGYVVFDEIHYINDPERGVVWEESLILLPPEIPIIMLSATIPNAEDIKEWMEAIKNKPFNLIKHFVRPVPLQPYYYNGKLHKYTGEVSVNRKEVLALKKKRKNQRAVKKGRKPENKVHTVFGNDFFSPVDILHDLDNSFYPIIYFIFSRKATQKAAKYVYQSNLKFITNKAEYNEIQNHINEYKSSFDAIEDLEQISVTIDYARKGIAFHHAGCLPIVKEFIETLFAKGLIKVLFATETFAMGLNLPAKSVVFHSIEKFDGVNFRLLLAGEFHQMAGRAGRRGIDTYGNAILVHNLQADNEEIKAIFDGEPEPLESQFRLSYNAICNLLQGRELQDIIGLLKSSYKEFTADKNRVSTNKRSHQQSEDIKKEIDKGIDCVKSLSNTEAVQAIEKYIGLNREYKALHARIELDLRENKTKEVVESIWNQYLPLGKIIRLRTKRDNQSLLGIIVGLDKEKKIMDEHNFFPVVALLETGRTARLLPNEYNIYSMIFPFNKVKPEHYNYETKKYQQLFSEIKFNLQQALDSNVIQEAKITEQLIRTSLENANIEFISHGMEKDEVDEVVVELEKHPCFNCEYYFEHKDAYMRLNRLNKKYSSIKRRLLDSQNLSYDAFKRMMGVLIDFKFVTKKGELNEKGYVLSNIHHDNDILLAETIHRKLFSGLQPSELVALFAIFSLGKKEKGAFERTPKIKSRRVLNIYNIMKSLDQKFQSREHVHDIPEINITRNFSLRLPELARLWCEGKDLDDLTPMTTMSEGDIVNHLRRVLSLMTQIRNIIIRMDIGISLDLFDEAIMRLRRSHVVPTLTEDVSSEVEEQDEEEDNLLPEDTFDFDNNEGDADEDEFMEPAVRF